MDEKTLVFSFLFISLLLSSFASATVDFIDFPYSNDTLSYSARIPLEVTSTASTGCYFNYDNIHNVSIGCNGESLVDLPNADGTYIIYVGDDAGSVKSQPVNVVRNTGFLITGFYVIFLLILMSIITNIVMILARLITFSYTPLEAGISFGLYFAVLFANWASIEYIRIPTVVNLTDGFVSWLAFPLILLPVIALILSIMFGKGKEMEKDIQRGFNR